MTLRCPRAGASRATPQMRGNSFSNNIPEIKDAGTLRVGVKFVHPDYLMNITHYYTAEITPKPVTAGMIADHPFAALYRASHLSHARDQGRQHALGEG